MRDGASELARSGPARGIPEDRDHRGCDSRSKVAISWRDGAFGAVSGTCNHAGGPLGKGRLDGTMSCVPGTTGSFTAARRGRARLRGDRVPAYEVRVEKGRLLVRTDNPTARHKKPHPPHPLARRIERRPGVTRVAGISTTNMDEANPRYSTSDFLLGVALDHARDALGCETKLIRLSALKFRQLRGLLLEERERLHLALLDHADGRGRRADEVYEALVHWADVVLVSTPIRWGVASALYFKMAERLNCIQNQITIRDNVLIRRKVAAFLITGGQDNVQAWPARCCAFSPSSGFTSRNSPTSRTRAAGPPRTWSATSST